MATHGGCVGYSRRQLRPLKNLHCPKLDSGLPTLIADLEERWAFEGNDRPGDRRVRPKPQAWRQHQRQRQRPDGRDHWPYCYTSIMRRRRHRPRRGLRQERPKTASSPAEDGVHPTQLLATVYHAMGIHPDTMVHNHLGQPRELVQPSRC